jgi:hypothetical protein
MTRAGRNRPPHRGRMRFQGTSAFSRWIAIPFLVVIGLILWLGVLADSSGQWKAPGAGRILYLVAVIAAAAFLAHRDRNGDS